MKRLVLVSQHVRNCEQAMRLLCKVSPSVRDQHLRTVLASVDLQMASHLADKFDHVDKGNYNKVKPSTLEDIYMLACMFYYDSDSPILTDDQHDALGKYMAGLDHKYSFVTKEDLKATTRPGKYPAYLRRVYQHMGVE